MLRNCPVVLKIDGRGPIDPLDVRCCSDPGQVLAEDCRAWSPWLLGTAHRQSAVPRGWRKR